MRHARLRYDRVAAILLAVTALTACSTSAQWSGAAGAHRSQPVASGTATPAPAAPRSPNKIAFISSRSGTFNIYLINPDGSHRRQLTQYTTGDVAGPALSPDGRSVVFTRWPKTHDEPPDLWVVGVDGRGLTNITEVRDADNYDYDPSWSPDGTKIVFASDRSWNNIYQMDPDGSDLEQLTFAKRTLLGPAYSHDGTKIAYLDCDATDAPRCQLWTIKADGSGARRLTRVPIAYERPAWSPDGERIAFTRRANGNADVYAMSVTTGAEKRLTSGPADDYQPAWSPDGTRIAFGSNRDGPPSLYLMHADGTGVSRLTTPLHGDDEDLSWQ
jgi:Tol biopolymer transport system component